MTLKGYEVLKAITQKGLSSYVEQVIGAKDKNVQNDYYNDIRQLCLDYGIPFNDRLESYIVQGSFSISVSWRWLIDTSSSRLIVLHDSILPFYRGFAPLVNQLINRENQIGVSALFAEDAYDVGEILFQEAITINYPIKVQEAIEKITPLYGKIVIQILEQIQNGKGLTGKPQDETKATYSLWRDEQDYFISWHQSAAYIQRFIDAVGFPYQGAKCYLNNKIITVLDAMEVEDKVIINRDVGKVLYIDDDCPVIVCGCGLLKITKAVFKANQKSVIPLQRFRSRFH